MSKREDDSVIQIGVMPFEDGSGCRYALEWRKSDDRIRIRDVSSDTVSVEAEHISEILDAFEVITDFRRRVRS